ncbi:30S ribosomal protein S7 [Candidatus Bathyarchaeota archaeon ex4484_231]|nr:MAG: 30S ribosomal protein S7 [Candidatus Bathyarchaeota archaeon ex4484_231]RLG90196.1 MAG: 30S ribosomal protein S7 [Candidatus Bathyarchaeota archaeon]RLI28308.1 MAG: 30S ribosomal protein S7 [Candidatus Bathyarchaeota archaeon]
MSQTKTAKAKKTREKPEIKLFGKWSFEGIEVRDPGLKRYINLRPLVIPHTMGRHEHKRFRKAEVNIVERLVNNLMRPGKNAGKKARAINVVRNAFEIIHLRTGRNPIEVLVRAIENSAPCEDTTRISYGGIVYHLSVDIAPQRRVDLALRFLCEGARQAAIGNPRPLEECLAEELILAANHDMKSRGVSKRHEMERIAQANR